MHSIEVRIGRLLEVRILAIETLDDVARYDDDLLEIFGRYGGTLVGCSDLRKSAHSKRIYSPDVAEDLILRRAKTNANLERSAMLLPNNAVFQLQVERMIREAGMADRRSFREPTELEAWLGEVLTPSERARLTAFLRDDT